MRISSKLLNAAIAAGANDVMGESLEEDEDVLPVGLPPLAFLPPLRRSGDAYACFLAALFTIARNEERSGNKKWE